MKDKDTIQNTSNKIVDGLKKLAPDDFGDEMNAIKSGLNYAASKITHKSNTEDGPVPVDQLKGPSFFKKLASVADMVKSSRTPKKGKTVKKNSNSIQQEAKVTEEPQNINEPAKNKKGPESDTILGAFSDSLSGVGDGLKAIRDITTEKVPFTAPVFNALGTVAGKTGSAVKKAAKATAKGTIAMGQATAEKVVDLKESGALDRASEKLSKTASVAKDAILVGAGKIGWKATAVAKSAAQSAVKLEQQLSEKTYRTIESIRNSSDEDGIKAVLRDAERKIRKATDVTEIKNAAAKTRVKLNAVAEEFAEKSKKAIAEAKEAKKAKAVESEEIPAQQAEETQPTEQEYSVKAAEDAQDIIADKETTSSAQSSEDEVAAQSDASADAAKKKLPWNNPFEKLSKKSKELAKQAREKCAKAAADAKTAISEKSSKSADSSEEGPEAEVANEKGKTAGKIKNFALKMREKAENFILPEENAEDSESITSEDTVDPEVKPEPVQMPTPAPKPLPPEPQKPADDISKYIAQETIDPDALEGLLGDDDSEK